ncbi:MAG TPA: cytochrome c-type biogenesis protein [Anaerolineae bacterium]|nr:cytochrome c-type biogenesis protein [Anaerolineae bacterium]
MLRRLIILFTFCLALIPLTSYAQSEPITDNEVNEVAKDLFCPTCENTPLDVCPTETCNDWRQEIRRRLGQGQDKDEITAYFAATYGNHVLNSPPREGFDLIIWILPWATILVAAFIFAFYLRKIQAPTPATSTPTPTKPTVNTDDPDMNQYLASIEQELEERDTK